LVGLVGFCVGALVGALVVGALVGLFVGVLVVGLVVGVLVVGSGVGFAANVGLGVGFGGLHFTFDEPLQEQPSCVEASQASSLLHLVQKYLQVCGLGTVVAHDDVLLVHLHLLALQSASSKIPAHVSNLSSYASSGLSVGGLVFCRSGFPRACAPSMRPSTTTTTFKNMILIYVYIHVYIYLNV
jgi:hypothetical protein